jgi:hypothetical protein
VSIEGDFRNGSIAPNAARVLQQRMSVAARKRQLATKVRRVVKGHKETTRLKDGESEAAFNIHNLDQYTCYGVSPYMAFSRPCA